MDKLKLNINYRGRKETHYYTNENGDVVSKKCQYCGEFLPLSEYYKNKKYFLDTMSICKECKKESQSEWVQNNRERTRENSKRWMKENKERHRTVNKLHYQNNKEYYKQKVVDRKNKMKKANHNLNTFLKEKLIEVQNNKCILTGKEGNLSLDHFIPINWGVSGSSISNCMYIDCDLNANKGEKTLSNG